MRLLVFGASGKTGSELVRQALERKHHVTAFVRNPSRLNGMLEHVVPITGNVADSGAVERAMGAGHDAVISALGVSKPLKHDPDVVAGIGNIVEAMREIGLARLLYLSFIGVRDSRAATGFMMRWIAPVPLREEIADHEAKEEIVRASGLDWTIVRPPKLTEGPRTGGYRAGEDIRTNHPFPTFSRADLAHFILGEVESPRFVRRTARLLA